MATTIDMIYLATMMYLFGVVCGLAIVAIFIKRNKTVEHHLKGASIDDLKEAQGLITNEIHRRHLAEVQSRPTLNDD